MRPKALGTAFAGLEVGTAVAHPTGVAKPKQLVRDGLVGFLLGILVMSTVAIVTWQSRSHASQGR